MVSQEDICQLRIIHEERIERARQKALDAGEIEILAQFFKALADPTRLKIILSLKHGEMCVCDLAAYLEVTESAVSHQLRLLRQLQLVSKRRQGPVLYYSLVDEHASRLVGLAFEHIRHR